MNKHHHLEEDETLGPYKITLYFLKLILEYLHLLIFPVYNRIVKLVLEQLNLRNQLRVIRKKQVNKPLEPSKSA